MSRGREPKSDTGTEWTASELERKAIVEAGGAVVAHLTRDARLVAWAKTAGRFARIDRRSRWGNPFVIGKDGDRAAVLERFHAFITGNHALLDQLDSLRGKVLGCWCYPDGCHGNELVRLIGCAHEHASR